MKKPQIQMINSASFKLHYRGQDMSLIKSINGDWEMWTQNAATRAWGSPGVKVFTTLEQVEAHYKSWKGICQLVSNLEAAPLSGGENHEQVVLH